MRKDLYELLTAPREDRKQINRCIQQINDLRISMLPTAIRYDKDKVQASPDDPMIKFGAKLEKLEAEKRIYENKYIEDYNAADNMIRQLENADLQAILTYKYLGGIQYIDIAKRMNYSRSYIEKLHGRAIRKLENKTKCASECKKVQEL